MDHIRHCRCQPHKTSIKKKEKENGAWSFLLHWSVFPEEEEEGEEEEHPAVQKGETVTDYQIRTEQYWLKVARSNMGPDAKDKKVAKVAVAMAKVFYEDQ